VKTVVLTTHDDLILDISPNDEMHSVDKLVGDWYWEVGRSSLEVLAQCLTAAHKAPQDVTRILDFPCGHGRVLRHLKSAFPQARITACDLVRDGVDFCARTFGATPCYSDEDPARIPLERDAFDLIWVGSLFTHLDAHRWIGFLELLASTLRLGGVLVFTTHGQFVYNRMRGVEHPFDYGLGYWRDTIVKYDYERRGFGYAHYPGVNAYGISLSAPSWVCTQIGSVPSLTLQHFAARAWHNNQDVYACVRTSETQLPAQISSFQYLKHRSRDLVPNALVEVARTVLPKSILGKATALLRRGRR
jgi:SAM-dependent methyltransferase